MEMSLPSPAGAQPSAPTTVSIPAGITDARAHSSDMLAAVERPTLADMVEIIRRELDLPSDDTMATSINKACRAQYPDEGTGITRNAAACWTAVRTLSTKESPTSSGRAP